MSDDWKPSYGVTKRFNMRDHELRVRGWRCETCRSIAIAKINPVECTCGGEYVQAPDGHTQSQGGAA